MRPQEIDRLQASHDSMTVDCQTQGCREKLNHELMDKQEATIKAQAILIRAAERTIKELVGALKQARTGLVSGGGWEFRKAIVDHIIEVVARAE